LTCLDAVSALAGEAPAPGSEPISPVPEVPALDPQRVALGEELFKDRRLSGGETISCASCHDIQTNGASANAHDAAPGGQPLPLNTPTVFNAALNFRLSWTGSYRTLEEAADQILRNPAVMATSPEQVVQKLRRDPEKVRQFRAAYGREPDAASLLDALATYQRSLITPGSRFDRWLAGDAGAITGQELAGYRMFKSFGCVSCHQGVNVGGNLYQRHDIFHPLGSAEPQLLRVPSLRNVAATAPYFHDGSAATLAEAVKAMGRAQLGRVLSGHEIAGIVAFLGTLTGSYGDRPVEPSSAASGSGKTP
jgi:cytochrome c peroxidase